MLFPDLIVDQETKNTREQWPSIFLSTPKHDKFTCNCFPSADSTGTHSLYTNYKDYEIMFHVSTMLPYTPNNKQQVW